MRSVALRALGAAAALASGSAEAATPTALWQGVAGLNIHCLVSTTAGVDTALQERLCARVRALASVAAPIPVTAIAAGDPALLAPDRVTLLVHASVQPGPLLVFAVRPFRNSDSPVLFGAAPHAVPLADEHALETALGAALSETLPWRAAPTGSRPITR